MSCRYLPGKDLFILRPHGGTVFGFRILMLGALFLLTATAAVRLLPRGGIVPVLCIAAACGWLLAALLVVRRLFAQTVRIRPGSGMRVAGRELPPATVAGLSFRVETEHGGPVLLAVTEAGPVRLLDLGFAAGDDGCAGAACFLQMMLARCDFLPGPEGALFFQRGPLPAAGSSCRTHFPAHAPWIGWSLFAAAFVMLALIIGGGFLLGWRWLRGDAGMLLPAVGLLLPGGAAFFLYYRCVVRRLRRELTVGLIFHKAGLLSVRAGYWHAIPRAMVAGVESGGRNLLPGLRHRFRFYSWGTGLTEQLFVCRLSRDRVDWIRSWMAG